MSTTDEKVLRMMFEGAPESWIVASTGKVESLQAVVGKDHALVLTKVQQLMELMPSAAPARTRTKTEQTEEEKSAVSFVSTQPGAELKRCLR
jgi:hypothetical protein